MSRRARQATVGNTGNHRPNLADEIRRLQKTHALLIAVQFAVNYEVEFDISDALAVIVALIDELLASLDRLEAST